VEHKKEDWMDNQSRRQDIPYSFPELEFPSCLGTPVRPHRVEYLRRRDGQKVDKSISPEKESD
jgi:hypothetical protein